MGSFQQFRLRYFRGNIHQKRRKLEIFLIIASNITDFYICDKQLMGKCGCFFSARQLSHFTRQVAHFTRSWSSGKMLAFQPRGFVFEPVGMRVFFYKYSEAESSHFFRHYETFRLCGTFCRNFLNVPKESSFQFF